MPAKRSIFHIPFFTFHFHISSDAREAYTPYQWYTRVHLLKTAQHVLSPRTSSDALFTWALICAHHR